MCIVYHHFDYINNKVDPVKTVRLFLSNVVVNRLDDSVLRHLSEASVGLGQCVKTAY